MTHPPLSWDETPVGVNSCGRELVSPGPPVSCPRVANLGLSLQPVGMSWLVLRPKPWLTCCVQFLLEPGVARNAVTVPISLEYFTALHMYTSPSPSSKMQPLLGGGTAAVEQPCCMGLTRPALKCPHLLGGPWQLFNGHKAKLCDGLGQEVREKPISQGCRME